MSVKDIEFLFLDLNTQFVDLKTKIDNLTNKYEDLEKQLKRRKKSCFKCTKCRKKFENVKELQKHKTEETACQGNFKCDECEKTFKSEKQLSVHSKKHETFPCDECDCEFNFEGLLEKHSQAVHGSMKIFCHYYNNDKECPYDDQCIYAHEESPDCKFGKGCERIKCMFQHDENDEDDEDDDDDESDNDDDDDENQNDECVVNIEEIEPCLKKVEEAMEKVKIMIEKQTSILKCDLCEFEGKNGNGLNMHKKAKHTDNSK
jgi:hypothetical protein